MTAESLKEVGARWLFGQPASTVILGMILAVMIYGANTYIPVVLDRFDRHIMTERELFERRLDRLETVFRDESNAQRDSFSRAIDSITRSQKTIMEQLTNEEALKN